jgi:beta-alanine degradation protein BauB
MLERLFAIGLGCAAIVAAQDPMQVSPDYKAEIENNWVRVLRVKRGPHGKTPMHQHPASVLVFLTDYHQKVTGADGKVREIT